MWGLIPEVIMLRQINQYLLPYVYFFEKELSIKDVRSKDGRGFVQCGQGEGAFFRCGCPHFLVQKT